MRRFSILVSIALALTIAAPTVAANSNNGVDTHTVYLALGDSLAVGDGASDMATTAYVPMMADYFAGTPHGGAKQAVNLAIGGETTGSFLAGQLTAALGVIADPATDVRMVTISLGGNDLLDLLNETTDPCVINPGSGDCQALLLAALVGVNGNYPNVMGALATALAQDPGAEKIFVLTVYNAFGGLGEPYEEPVDAALLGADSAVDCAAAAANPFNAGLDDLITCTSLGVEAAFAGLGIDVVMVDGYAIIDDNALALTHIGDPGFNIHPNDLGYAAIAEAHRWADRAS